MRTEDRQTRNFAIAILVAMAVGTAVLVLLRIFGADMWGFPGR